MVTESSRECINATDATCRACVRPWQDYFCEKKPEKCCICNQKDKYFPATLVWAWILHGLETSFNLFITIMSNYCMATIFCVYLSCSWYSTAQHSTQQQ